MRRISRTIFKMLAPVIGCSLREGPWRSSIFVVVGRLIMDMTMDMSPLWTGDIFSDDCRHPSDIS